MADKFDVWGILELFGHKKIAGRISEQSIGAITLIRVDVPGEGDQPGFTKMFGGSAIYGLTPTDELTARAAARSFEEKPLECYTIRDMIDQRLEQQRLLHDLESDEFDIHEAEEIG